MEEEKKEELKEEVKVDETPNNEKSEKEDSKEENANVEEEQEKVEEVKEDAVLGFDFGSTKISCAIMSNRSQFPELVRNELSNRTTPSVIAFSSHRLVGEPADLVKSRGNAITNVKSLICAEGETGKKVVDFKGKDVKLHSEHLALMLFNRIGESVKLLPNDVQRDCKKIVISVPPAFKPEEVKKLHTAATLAGYTVLDKPVYDVTCSSLVYAHRTAASISSERELIKTKKKKATPDDLKNLEALEEPVHMLVLDFGHDFISAQVSFVDPKSNHLKVLANESKRIGAASYTSVLTRMMTDLLASKHKIELDKLKPLQRDRAEMRMEKQAEKAKVMLSGLQETTVVVDSVVPDVDMKFTVTRDEMQNGASKVAEEIKSMLESVVAKAGITNEQLSRVELVGGGSRIPQVQQVVKDMFGNINKTLDNECSVGFGAALYGGIIQSFVDFKVEGETGPGDYLSASGLEDAVLEEIKSLEQEMQDDDADLKKRSDAKNLLETFVFDLRREANETEEAHKDDEETLDKLRSYLSSVEDWMLENEEATAEETLTKLEEAKKTTLEMAPKLHQHLEKKKEQKLKEMLESQQSVPAETKKKKKAHLRPAEKIEDAKKKKQHGNQLFKDNNWEDATKRYTQALEICAEMDGTLAPDMQKEVNELKRDCYLNLTNCNIKLKYPKLGVNNATKAINLFPDTPKCYFRRAQAHFECKDFEEAKKDLLKAKKIDNEDKAIASLLVKVERAMEIEKKKQQKAYANMFK